MRSRRTEGAPWPRGFHRAALPGSARSCRAGSWASSPSRAAAAVRSPESLRAGWVHDGHLVVKDGRGGVQHRIQRRRTGGQLLRIVSRKDRLHRDNRGGHRSALIGIVARGAAGRSKRGLPRRVCAARPSSLGPTDPPPGRQNVGIDVQAQGEQLPRGDAGCHHAFRQPRGISPEALVAEGFEAEYVAPGGRAPVRSRRKGGSLVRRPNRAIAAASRGRIVVIYVPNVPTRAKQFD